LSVAVPVTATVSVATEVPSRGDSTTSVGGIRSAAVRLTTRTVFSAVLPARSVARTRMRFSTPGARPTWARQVAKVSLVSTGA